MIMNYGDRYRNGKTIPTAFVKSTANEVISKRFVKKQQMYWTKKGEHRLLQVRVQVPNNEWRQTFYRHSLLGAESTDEQKVTA